MAQPFPRAWDILKQRPFTHEEVVARNRALPPIGQMGQPQITPQEYGAVEMPQEVGMMPSLGEYTQQQQPMGDEMQNRIAALRMQIAALQQELEMLVTMQGQYGPPQQQFSPGAFY